MVSIEYVYVFGSKPSEINVKGIFVNHVVSLLKLQTYFYEVFIY